MIQLSLKVSTFTSCYVSMTLICGNSTLFKSDYTTFEMLYCLLKIQGKLC